MGDIAHQVRSFAAWEVAKVFEAWTIAHQTGTHPDITPEWLEAMGPPFQHDGEEPAEYGLRIASALFILSKVVKS